MKKPKINFLRRIRDEVNERVEAVVLPIEQDAIGRIVSIGLIAVLLLLALSGIMHAKAAA